MPILAKKTIESAGVKKDRLILIPVFSLFGIRIFRIAATRSSRTDPVPHTVCRERIVVPGKISFVGPTPDKLCPDIESCPAESLFPRRYPALIDTELA